MKGEAKRLEKLCHFNLVITYFSNESDPITSTQQAYFCDRVVLSLLFQRYVQTRTIQLLALKNKNLNDEFLSFKKGINYSSNVPKCNLDQHHFHAHFKMYGLLEAT